MQSATILHSGNTTTAASNGERRLKAEFTCSYAGEVDYNIRDAASGRIITKVAARYFANSRMAYNGDYFETGIKPQVGTVRYYSSDNWREFPPADIVALFPGFIGQRLVFHEKTPGLNITQPGYQSPDVEYQYDGERPQLVPDLDVPEYLTFRGRPYHDGRIA